MPYKVKGKCVYLKSTGKKVGCTKGSVKKYLSALHANVNESEDDGLDWIREAKPNPLEFYYDRGYNDIGLIVKSYDETKILIELLHSMDYSWGFSDFKYNPFEPNDFIHGERRAIWANKDKVLQHSDLKYKPQHGEILIDNPFRDISLNESENDDLDWIRDIQPCTAEFPCVGMRFKIILSGGFDHKVVYEIMSIDDESFYLGWGDYPEIGVTAESNVKWRQKYYYGFLSKNQIEVVGWDTNLNESSGISFEAREWSDIVEGEILNNPQERTRIIIDGYDYPDTFEKFPIDYIVIDFHDNITGYDHTKSGYDKDGNYIVLLYIQPQLIQGVRDYTLKSALNHEFRHAYEDYQRRSKGQPTIDQTKDAKLFYTQDLIRLINNRDITGPIKDILRFYYYVSNIEKSAYMENIYDMNREYERIIREIISKDFESYKDRFDLDINWHLVNVAYDIPITKKFKSPRKFIDYSAKFLRQKALKILKKINKIKYVHNKM